MSFENVKNYFKSLNLEDRIIVLDESSATVIEAAHAIGCQPKQIAKTMSFLVNEQPIVIVLAGDTKVDNKKFKQTFFQKAKMIHGDQVENYIGHAPGGVCPFVCKDEVAIYLDESLKRFDKVYPAAGNGHSAISLSVSELEKYTNKPKWIDVGKIMEN